MADARCELEWVQTAALMAAVENAYRKRAITYDHHVPAGVGGKRKEDEVMHMGNDLTPLKAIFCPPRKGKKRKRNTGPGH